MSDDPAGPEGQGQAPPPLTTRGELIAAAALVVGAFVLIGGILAFVGATGTDDPGPSPTLSVGPSASASLAASPTQASFPIVPQNPDEQAIDELARRSIVLPPQGQWPDLYQDFTADFRDRCTLEDFTQAGIDASDQLGENLALLDYVGMRELNITDETARAVIVGELQSEYEVETFFRVEDGAWKIAPAPGTTGCSAFNRLAA